MKYSDYRELITMNTVYEYNKKHRKISYLEQWIICKKEVDEMLQRNGIRIPYKPKYYRTANHIIYTNKKFIPKRNKKGSK